MKKIAITALVKGFTNIEKYHMLISRNRHIKENFIPKLTDHVYDILIFHEGNIPIEHQSYINEKSELDIKYIDLSNLRNLFSASGGYWFMSRFWTYDFLNYLSNYDFVVRVDDDCDMISVDRDELNYIFNNDINFASAAMISNMVEAEFRRKMHKEFINEYCAKNNIVRKKEFDEILLTYPNFMITNIQYYRNHKLVQNFLNSVINNPLNETLEMGDANVWGMILAYIDDVSYYKMKKIQYQHHSHHKMVYGTTNDEFGYMIGNWPD